MVVEWVAVDASSLRSVMENDKFRHNCWEWDGMSIGCNSIELASCMCFEGAEFKALQNKLQKEYNND